MCILTAYHERQKVGNHNALSGNTTLGTRGPGCGIEHYIWEVGWQVMPCMYVCMYMYVCICIYIQ